MITKLIISVLAMAIASCAGTQPPLSVSRYELSIRKLQELGHPSPVYAASCPGSLDGELVAFGCLDICAMVDGYRGHGYQFARHDMIGDKQYRWVHPKWGLPLYFTSEISMRQCVPMLESGKLIVAYGGWCTAGVEDLDVHFSSPNRSPYRVDSYDGMIVVYLTNMAKTKVLSSPDLQAHVAMWLKHLDTDEVFDVRGLYVPVMLDDYTGYQPPRDGVHWTVGK
jgi:hypothetical protein